MSGGFRKRSEATEQEHVVSWCFHREGMYPDLKWIHHCPNGGSRQKKRSCEIESPGRKGRSTGSSSTNSEGSICRIIHRNEIQYRNGGR